MKTTDHKMHRTEERKTLAETVAMDVHPKKCRGQCSQVRGCISLETDNLGHWVGIEVVAASSDQVKYAEIRLLSKHPPCTILILSSCSFRLRREQEQPQLLRRGG